MLNRGKYYGKDHLSKRNGGILQVIGRKDQFSLPHCKLLGVSSYFFKFVFRSCQLYFLNRYGQHRLAQVTTHTDMLFQSLKILYSTTSMSTSTLYTNQLQHKFKFVSQFKNTVQPNFRNCKKSCLKYSNYEQSLERVNLNKGFEKLTV